MIAVAESAPLSIHFANPKALVLLLLVALVFFWARRSLSGLGRARGSLALALRALIVTLAVLALAQAQWSFVQDEMSVIYVLDQSRSIPDSAQKEVLDYIRASQEQRHSGDSVGLIVFGGTAAIEKRPSREAVLQMPAVAAAAEAGAAADREIATLQSMVSVDRTHIAGAMRLALAAFPPSSLKRIVLISDGNENLGSVATEAEVARRNGIRIDVKPVVYTYPNEVMIEKIVAPSEAEKGASFEVRTVVTAHRAQPATLRLFQNDRMLANQPVELREGRNVYTVRRTLDEPGYYAFTAQVESAEDTIPANNRAAAFTIVRGEGRVLYVEGDRGHGGNLLRALRQQRLDVHAAGAEAMPLSIGQLIPYDTVILSNVPAGLLGGEGMRAIELAVKDWGVGLVVIGGEHAYGPGGYQDSPLERALPVSMDIKQRRIMPSGALVIVLHTCEIARGNYWARQVALAALRVLSPFDEFGIIYYDWNKGDTWLFPLQRIQNKARLAAMINNCGPGDMPSFIRAFQMAHTALKASTASVKHSVVISDGDPAYPSDKAVQAMVADGITISTVAINPHSALDGQRLSHVAAMGNGRYYPPPSASSQLPQIFIKEAATVRRALIFEEPFKPVVQLSSEIIKGIAPDEFPTLRGYVLTTPKQLAEIPLVSQNKDPVLAHWQFGLGRAVAFTSDANARWAAHWLGWPKYKQFWAQVVRWCARSVEQAGLRARAEVVEDRARVVVDAIDEQGRFRNGLKFVGVLVTPDHKEIVLHVVQTGPGRYEAEFDAPASGTHYLSLRYTDAKGRPALYTHGLVVPYSAEYRELKTNDHLLASLARSTGGRVLAAGDDAFARTFPPTARYRHAWPYLLLLAVILMPFDVLVRRVFLDYAAIYRRVRVVAGHLPMIGRRRPAARPAHLSALLSARQTTREAMQRRARKFQPSEEVEADESTLAPEAHAERPKAEAAERPEVHRGGPSVRRDDETYLGRLLRAKRKAREDESKHTDDSTGDETES